MKTLFFLFLTIPFLLTAQTKKGTLKVRKANTNNLIDESSQVFTIAEVMPTFPGGEGALNQFLSNTIKYPELAKKNNISGTVYVSFIVDKSGVIRNIKILRGANEVLDAEAIRVITKMPNWIPGMQKGENVDVIYNLPINFRLK